MISTLKTPSRSAAKTEINIHMDERGITDKILIVQPFVTNLEHEANRNVGQELPTCLQTNYDEVVSTAIL
jgi:hypothetical protein